MTKYERIEKLLHELQYEVETGMMQGEVDETLKFQFIIPTSKMIPNGIIVCKFETTPIHRQYFYCDELGKQRLKIVK